MNRIGQKWISSLLALTLMWLLAVSSMPLAAADGSQKSGLENSGSGTGFVESIGQKPALAEKKGVLPYLLVGVGVAAVAAILFLFVLNTKYDVTGYWTGIETYDGNSRPYFRWFEFSGDRKSGTVETIDPATSSVIATVPYVVDGKKITWSDQFFQFSGAFDSAAKINGEIFFRGGKIGTFALTRASSDLMVPPQLQECNIIGTWVFEFNNRGGILEMTIVFSGNKTNGEFKAEESDWMTGTYTVVNTDVTLLTTDKPDIRFSGRFIAKDTMAGSWIYMSESWNWTARRHYGF